MRLTRKRKQDALELFRSRVLTESLAFNFVGWMEGEAHKQLNGESAPEPTANTLARFVEFHSERIRACPLAKLADKHPNGWTYTPSGEKVSA